MKQLLLPALTLLLTQCQKSDSGPAKPENQLPAATQTGAGTFGCLLNGQPWTPSGRVGTPNFILAYDPGYVGGSLTVRAYRAEAHKITQYVGIDGTQIKKLGTYVISEAATSTCGAGYTYPDGSACSDYS